MKRYARKYAKRSDRTNKKELSELVNACKKNEDEEENGISLSPFDGRECLKILSEYKKSISPEECKVDIFFIKKIRDQDPMVSSMFMSLLPIIDNITKNPSFEKEEILTTIEKQVKTHSDKKSLLKAIIIFTETLSWDTKNEFNEEIKLYLLNHSDILLSSLFNFIYGEYILKEALVSTKQDAKESYELANQYFQNCIDNILSEKNSLFSHKDNYPLLLSSLLEMSYVSHLLDNPKMMIDFLESINLHIDKLSPKIELNFITIKDTLISVSNHLCDLIDRSSHMNENTFDQLSSKLYFIKSLFNISLALINKIPPFLEKLIGLTQVLSKEMKQKNRSKILDTLSYLNLVEAMEESQKTMSQRTSVLSNLQLNHSKKIEASIEEKIELKFPQRPRETKILYKTNHNFSFNIILPISNKVLSSLKLYANKIGGIQLSTGDKTIHLSPDFYMSEEDLNLLIKKIIKTIEKNISLNTRVNEIKEYEEQVKQQNYYAHNPSKNDNTIPLIQSEFSDMEMIDLPKKEKIKTKGIPSLIPLDEKEPSVELSDLEKRLLEAKLLLEEINPGSQYTIGEITNFNANNRFLIAVNQELPDLNKKQQKMCNRLAENPKFACAKGDTGFKTYANGERVGKIEKLRLYPSHKKTLSDNTTLCIYDKVHFKNKRTYKNT